MLGWRLGSIVVLSLALWPRRRCRGSVKNWLGDANIMATRKYDSRKKPLQVAADAEVDDAPLVELRECPCAHVIAREESFKLIY